MATKHSRKNTNYDRKKLAHKLEDLSERVAARGIYVARPNDYNQWDLYDYAHDVVVFDNLPNKEIANCIAASYNKNKKFAGTKQGKIRRICNDISKHNTDCIFYIYNMQNSKDAQTAQYTYTRIQTAKDRISELMRELNLVLR